MVILCSVANVLGQDATETFGKNSEVIPARRPIARLSPPARLPPPPT